jgi:hypothetical protein
MTMAEQSRSTPATPRSTPAPRTSRAAGASRAATTRSASATKRSTAAKKGAATRSRQQAAAARTRSTAAKKAAETRHELAKTPVDVAQEYAERALLIPFGAVLMARDKAVTTVEELANSLSNREKAEKELIARRKRLEAELKRFERRGRTERNRVERLLKRRVKRSRTRVERELRSTGKDVAAQADLLTARVENLVQTGITRGTQVATKVQERVASVA